MAPQTESRIILFQDIRDSTKLLFDAELEPALSVLMHAYYLALIGAVEMNRYPRSRYDIKTTGDGAMLTLDADGEPLKHLPRVLNIIRVFHQYMPTLVAHFNRKFGTEIQLRFGWGVSEGTVHKLGQQYYRQAWDLPPETPSILDKSFPPGFTDFIGPPVVRASRLCDLARPEGVLIDAERFPELPANPTIPLQQTEIGLKGFSHRVPVWHSATVDLAKVNALNQAYGTLEP